MKRVVIWILIAIFLITTFALRAEETASSIKQQTQSEQIESKSLSKKQPLPEEVSDRYGYFSYGFGFPRLFFLNIGSRIQEGHNGFEYGIGVTPLVFIYDVHAFVSYLYYPKPNLNSQFYFGLGLSGGYASLVGGQWKDAEGFFAPGFILGKSYKNDNIEKKFVQVSCAPAGYVKGKFRIVPSISICYGYCF